jgi:glycosyltransferase involved in cell wall biosynthesis
MTVHNKVYEGMAMGKPVITGQSPAIAAQFHSGEELLACPRTPQGLAESILQLKEDPALRARLGANALHAFQERYSLQSLGKLLLGYLHEFDR